MRLFILLPSFNEEKALPNLLKSIQELVEDKYYDYEVVIINDGSLDKTEDVAKLWAEKLSLRIINHKHNMGLGEAINTGLSYFNDACSDNDIAIVMDADNTHTPKTIPCMIDGLDLKSDVIIASRYNGDGKEIGLSFLRKLCSKGACVLLKFFFNIPGVKDYTCGYRAYSGRAIRKAYRIYGNSFIEEKGFTCMAEILIKLHYMGCTVSEVPLTLRYDLKKGRSKMRVPSTIGHYFTLIHKIKRYDNILTSLPAFINGKEK